jgi:hypothetical protein
VESGRTKPNSAAVEAAYVSERPEILDEAAIADEELALERRGPVDLMQIPRLLGGALADIRTIAEGMATLPKVLISLNGIKARVDSLDDEVKKMRAAVEEMGGGVSGLEQSIGRLEPHLEDVSRVAHPLRRLGDRSRRRSVHAAARAGATPSRDGRSAAEAAGRVAPVRKPPRRLRRWPATGLARQEP